MLKRVLKTCENEYKFWGKFLNTSKIFKKFEAKFKNISMNT